MSLVECRGLWNDSFVTSSRPERVGNHSSSQKTKLNNLSYGVKISTDLSSVLSQCTRLTDGQMDRQTEFSSLDRVRIPCSAVKTETNIRKT